MGEVRRRLRVVEERERGEAAGSLSFCLVPHRPLSWGRTLAEAGTVLSFSPRGEALTPSWAKLRHYMRHWQCGFTVRLPACCSHRAGFDCASRRVEAEARSSGLNGKVGGGRGTQSLAVTRMGLESGSPSDSGMVAALWQWMSCAGLPCSPVSL